MRHRDLLGPHHLERVIAEADGSRTHATGTATLMEGPDILIYREDLTLTLATGAQLAATRVYLWHPVTGGFDVHFDDGRFFHALRWDSPQAAHWCDPDQYDVTYDWSAWPAWTSTWRVKGPRKDYTMHSRYRHQPPIAPLRAARGAS